MKAKEIKQLTEKYLEGKTTLREEQILRDYFHGEDVADELQPYADQFRYYENMEDTEVPDGFNPFAKIDFESATGNSSVEERKRRRSTWVGWPMRIAAGILLLLTGFAAGRYWNSSTKPVGSRQNPKVQQMRTALMSADEYDRPSAGQRLSAVNISQTLAGESKTLDQQVAEVLTYTMNNDENVNVRAAAADALFKYRDDVRIKSSLIHALGRQEDPFMQITLIRMLVKLHAKEAIPAMQQLLVSSQTRGEVRGQLKAGIAQLQT